MLGIIMCLVYFSLTESEAAPLSEQVEWENNKLIYIPDMDVVIPVTSGFYCTSDNILMQEDAWFKLDMPVYDVAELYLYSCEVVTNTPSGTIRKRITA